MSRRLWCDEMADPVRPPEQRAREATYRELTDEECDRMIAATFARERREHARAMAAMELGRMEMAYDHLHPRRTLRASRARIVDRIGTVGGVLVLALLAWVVVGGGW